MANSKYEYVKNFERDEVLLPNVWIVVRIDGRGFHKLSTYYSFTKPNDCRALMLMNAAASGVVQQFPDICIAYGVSDEYSFVFHKSTELFERRAAKLVSTIVSTFTAFYVHLWGSFMEGIKLESAWLPTFDGRAVCYPSLANLRDYLSWRQVDCHINNLYNTTFWAMIQRGGLDATATEGELKGTFSSDKNEILFSRYGINYNNEPEMFKKGSVIFREYELENGTGVDENENKRLEHNSGAEANTEVSVRAELPSKTQAEKLRKAKAKASVVVGHIDIIKDEFWEKRPWVLSGKPGKPVRKD